MRTIRGVTIRKVYGRNNTRNFSIEKDDALLRRKPNTERPGRLRRTRMADLAFLKEIKVKDIPVRTKKTLVVLESTDSVLRALSVCTILLFPFEVSRKLSC